MKKRLLVASLLLASSLMAGEGEIQRNTLTVVGQGKAKVLTAISDVDLGVEVQGKSAQEVQRALARQIQPIVDYLQKQKVEQLQTGSVNVSPQYSRDTPSYIVGYTGSNTISFSAPIERAGMLIDGAVQAGANRLQSVRQRPSDQAITQAQQEAIRSAIQDATSQSQEVMDALALKKRWISKITVAPFGGQGILPFSYRSMNVEAGTSRAMPILPQEQQIEATVTLEVTYE